MVLPCVRPLASAQTGQSTKLYEYASNQWFEALTNAVSISADGKWALFTSSQAVRLVALQNGHEDQVQLSAGLDAPPRAAAFCGTKLARVGKRGTETGWFIPDVDGQLRLTSVPPDALLQCSRDTSEIAYYFPDRPDTGISILIGGKRQDYPLKGKVTGAAFTLDGKALFAVSLGMNGRTSLVRITPPKPGVGTVTSDLDAMPSRQTIGMSADAQSIYIALASDAVPNNAARHQPNVQRWLKIYQLHPAKDRHVVVQSANKDNFDPAVVNGDLYWGTNVLHSAVALMPTDGGEAKEIVAEGQVPVWSFDGHRLSYFFGDMRLADLALNLDAAVIGVDAQGRKSSGPTVIVSGYNEDFPAAISPNGRWIAFHSHRSKTPVPIYDSPGSADDIFLRRADDLHAPEIRLTNFGWETGPAFWSPDGRKLLFSSWVKGGQPGIYKLWVITVDPESGKALSTGQFPLPPDPRSAQWAAWSPDGKEIAIEDDRSDEQRRIWIIKADGSHGEKLLDYKGSTYGGVDWTPDGATVIYSGLAEGRMQLFAISRQGGSPRQLSHDSGNLLHPRVSPDGRWIACTRTVQSQQIWRMPLKSVASRTR
jgi:Tol biopolymer transport system component